MRKTFDAELHELGAEMIDMAAAAEDAIDLSPPPSPPPTGARPARRWT